MKTNDFITLINQPNKFGHFLPLQVFTAASALGLACIPLFLNNPINIWYLPLMSIFLFALSLVGSDLFQQWLQKTDSQHRDKHGEHILDNIRPVMITKFANQKASNSKPMKTAA